MKIRKMLPLLLLGTLTVTSCSSDQTSYTYEGFDNNIIEFGKKEVAKDKFGNYYHIFVPTYRDSNKDGIGDLQGVIDSLDYLRKLDNPYDYGSLGIDGIFLSPIFNAPSYHKYDAISYYEIDPKFGNMESLDKLIEECHKRGIKLIMDMAFNHMSTESEYFKKAVDALKNVDVCKNSADTPSSECIANTKEVDYFKFSKNKTGFANFAATVEGTSFYYESFSKGSFMADLNLENEDVLKMVEDVCKYYLKKGVDGFRLDAIGSFFGSSSNGVTSKQPLEKTNKVLNLIQNTVESYSKDNYVVAEGPWSTSTATHVIDSETGASLSNSNNLDSMFSFSNSLQNAKDLVSGNRIVNHIEHIKNGNTKLAEFLSRQFINYEYPENDKDKFIKDSETANHIKVQANFLSNHDIGRISGNFINYNFINSATEKDIEARLRAYKFFYGVYNLQYGSNFLYYGDELGMTGSKADVDGDYADTIARQPMLWEDKKLRPTLNQVPTDNLQKFDTSELTIKALGTMEKQIHDPNSLFNYLRQMYFIKGTLRDIQKSLATNVTFNNETGLLELNKTDDIKIIINCTTEEKTYKKDDLKINNNLSLKYYLTTKANEKVTEENGNIVMPYYSIAFCTKGGN